MTIKLANLGAGGIAEKHLNSLNKISDFKVNYICAIDLNKANKLAKKCSETIVFLPLDRSNLVYKDWRPKINYEKRI